VSWVTAEQALGLLGTKAQSLYASVSRGRVRMKPDPGDARKSLYDRDDIERLARRSAGRRRAASVAAEAIRWGDPVLASSITAVVAGRLYYRGLDAVVLAETQPLEAVASSLWEAPTVQFPARQDTMLRAHTIAPLRRAFAVVADCAATGGPMLGKSPGLLHAEAARLMAVLASAIGALPGEADVHTRLAGGWNRPEAADAIRRALVLLADHELNASTFAARVTASTGAALAAAALAGLAALTGPLHGSAPAGLMTLLPAVEALGAAGAVRGWMAEGRRLPGFGHPLYPEGDVRAKALLKQFELPPVFAALLEAGREITGEEPNVDFALAALALAYRLPPDAPLLIFALARCVGWQAHALEQNASGQLIRPRARYTGVPVGGRGKHPMSSEG
jgi:citrate synthase